MSVETAGQDFSAATSHGNNPAWQPPSAVHREDRLRGEGPPDHRLGAEHIEEFRRHRVLHVAERLSWALREAWRDSAERGLASDYGFPGDNESF